MDVVFIRDKNTYHTFGGEIHCGNNVCDMDRGVLLVVCMVILLR